ncbi:DUF3626 domain-containing protein [Kribbella voronezhensis]|nr:DUF3626 domain-containing protein [Kribbella voronezhensis]
MELEAAGSPQEGAVRYVASLSSGPPLDPALRVTLNFHPDRVTDDRPILVALAEDGSYHSQFVTGTSNGGLTAYAGGDRWNWESRIFGGAYDTALATERPVYGALNFHQKPLGAAPRFGSAHLRLTADAVSRATFCYPDSVFEPSDFGVVTRMSLIDLADKDDRDLLDDYIEAQIHGPVLLDQHVEALILDPSYQGTTIEDQARHLPCPLEWHAGLEITIDELRRHPQYRGPEYVALAAELAVDGRLTPRIIGDAARTNRYDQQSLKKIWHYLARFGTPPTKTRATRSRTT